VISTGVEYSYESSADDADGDAMFYRFEWGDEELSPWIGPLGTGEVCSASHIWEQAGVFQIRARAKDAAGAASDWSDVLPICVGSVDDNGNGFPDECEMQPDELHITGPVPNQIDAGDGGTVDAVVLASTFGQPGWEVMFTKLAGSFTFTAGTVTPDGTQASVMTDANGTAQMTFDADAAGSGLIGVTVSGTELPTAYSVFEIVEPPPAVLPESGEATGQWKGTQGIERINP